MTAAYLPLAGARHDGGHGERGQWLGKLHFQHSVGRDFFHWISYEFPISLVDAMKSNHTIPFYG